MTSKAHLKILPALLCTGLLLLPTASLAKKERDSSHLGNKSKKDSATEANITAEGGDNDAAPCVNWTDPLIPPRAALLCIHGLGLNSLAYTNFGRRLSLRGISVFAIDVRGFGSWMKSQGNTKLDFNATLRDIKTALETIHKANPGLPVFLLGESMGGAIAIRAASEYPDLIQGLISAVPAGERYGQKKEDVKVALDVLGHGLRKPFDIGTSIVSQATNNTKQKEAWEDDPLNRMDLSPEQLLEFQRFMNENIPAAKKITNIPVLIVQGILDKLVRPEGSWQIFAAMPNPEKTFLAFPSEHLIFEYSGTKTEAEARKSAQIAATWIFEHLRYQSGQALSFSAIRSLLSNNTSLLENPDRNSEEPSQPALSDDMQRAIALFNKGDFKNAVAAFREVLASDPQNVDAHIWLGLSYERTAQPALALAEALKARTLGKNTHQALRANQALTQLAEDPANQKSLTQVKAENLTSGKPTVLIFGAPWCVESSEDDGMINHGRKYFGNNVQFKKYNIDDPANANVIKQFSVGPIPTYIFLNSDGTVHSTQLGHSNFANFVVGVEGIASQRSQ